MESRIKKFLDSVNDSSMDKSQEAMVFSGIDQSYGGDNNKCSNFTLSACSGGVNTNCTNYNASCYQSYNNDCKNVRIDNCPISPEG